MAARPEASSNRLHALGMSEVSAKHVQHLLDSRLSMQTAPLAMLRRMRKRLRTIRMRLACMPYVRLQHARLGFYACRCTFDNSIQGLCTPDNHLHALGVPHVRLQHARLLAARPLGSSPQDVLLQPRLAPAHGPVAQLGGGSIITLLLHVREYHVVPMLSMSLACSMGCSIFESHAGASIWLAGKVTAACCTRAFEIHRTGARCQD